MEGLRMVDTAIQLQMLATLPETPSETIHRIGATPLEGVELWDPAVEDPSEIAAAVSETGLDVIGAHVSLDRIEHEYEDVVNTYDEIGCQRLIVPTLGKNAFESTDTIAPAAERVSRIARRLADDGFECCYHNDTVEFSCIRGQLAYDAFVEMLVDEPLTFELDTGLAVYAGADPAAILARHGDQIPLVHLTDSVPESETTIQVELGAGELPIESCVSRARDADVEWLVYEHGMTNDVLGSLTHGATKLPRLVNGHHARSQEDSSLASTD